MVPGEARTSVSRQQVALAAFMTLLSALNYFDRTTMSIAGPAIMKQFSISETQMGSVYSAFLVSYTALMIPAGWLADRVGARAAMGVTGIVGAVCLAFTAAAGTPAVRAALGIVPALFLVRFLFGICTAPLYPSCAKVTKDFFPLTRQAVVQAVVMAGAAIGAAVSPILFTWMIGQWGWQTAFMVAGLVTAVLFLCWVLFVRDPPRERGKRAATQWMPLLRNRNLIVLTASYFLLNYFEYIFFYWIFYYFGEIRHLPTAQSARATTVLFLTMAVMTSFGGWLSDRVADIYGLSAGRRWVSMIGMTISAVMLYLGVGDYGVIAMVALLSLALGFATCSEGPYWSTAIQISGEQAGAACGILNCGGNLGGMLAPVLTPVIAKYYGWTGGLYFGSFMVLLGVVLWLGVKVDDYA